MPAVSRKEYDERYDAKIKGKLNAVDSLYELVMNLETYKHEIANEMPGRLSNELYLKHIDHCQTQLDQQKEMLEASKDQSIEDLISAKTNQLILDTLREAPDIIKNITAVNSFINGAWADDRIATSRCVHYVGPVITSCILAITCKCYTAEQMAVFINQNAVILSILLPGANFISHPISASTIRNIISFGDPEVKRELFEQLSLAAQISIHGSVTNDYGFMIGYKAPDEFQKADTYGIDGQVLNGTYKKGVYDRGTKAGDVITFFNCSKRVAQSYSIAPLKNHEKDFIQEFAQTIPDSKSVIMWDALNSNPKTFAAVVHSGNDVLCPFKANQLSVFEPIKDIFDFLNKGKCKCDYFEYKTPELVVGGRSVSNEFIFIGNDLFPEEIKEKYPDAKSALWRKTTTYKVGKEKSQDPDKKQDNKLAKKTSSECKVYLSSLDFSAEGFTQALHSINEYWFIEQYHNVLDVNLKQDDMSACNLNYIEGRVVLNKIAASFLTWFRAEKAHSSGKAQTPSYDSIMTELSANVLKAAISLGKYYSTLASERELKCFGKNEPKLELDFCDENHLT